MSDLHVCMNAGGREPIGLFHYMGRTNLLQETGSGTNVTGDLTSSYTSPDIKDGIQFSTRSN